jgi:hypothetical protein
LMVFKSFSHCATLPLMARTYLEAFNDCKIRMLSSSN